MDTVTLQNGLKSLFGTSQSTATNIPTCAADGTPAGNISVANLASVLGALTRPLKFTSGAISDPDNVTESGWGYCTTPFNGALLTLFITEDVGTQYYHYYAHQIAFKESSPTSVKYRKKVNKTWTDWEEISRDIPSFYKDYSTLADLQTNVLNGITKGEYKSDANNIDVAFGVYALESLASNVKYASGILIHAKTGRVAYSYVQFNMDSSGSHFAFRIKNQSVWTSWVEIV